MHSVEEKPYSLYIPQPLLNAERAAQWRNLLETPNHGHACECETSISLANHAHLVKMDRVPCPGWKRLAAPGASAAHADRDRLV